MGLYFAIYYKNLATDKDEAFRRAAETWARKREGLCKMVSVTYVYELIAAFRHLAYLTRTSKQTYNQGAMFAHSSPPKRANDTSRGVHMASFKPKTLAELHYREDVLTPQGLDNDTLTPSLMNRLTCLPWSSDAKLYIYGCLSGTGSVPIAKLFADHQHVTTIGQTGKAYFSKSPYVYEEIGAQDKAIYLKAFYRPQNAALNVLETISGNVAEIPTVLWNRPMPERSFIPTTK